MVIWQQNAQSAQLRLERKYVAHTNQGFLLQETSQLATLLLGSEDRARIQEMVLTDNLLQLRAEASRKTTYRAVMTRLEGVPEALLELLVSGSVDSRRLANFYLILLKHRLLREFMAEVVLEQRQRLLSHISAVDVRTFFSRKQDQEPEIGAWSAATLQKSQGNIVNLTSSAGLLSKADGARWAIHSVFVPTQLREVITAQGHQALLPLMLDQNSHV